MMLKHLFDKTVITDLKHNFRRNRGSIIFLLVTNSLFTILYLLFTTLGYGMNLSSAVQLPNIDLTYRVQILNFNFFLYIIFGFFLVLRLFYYLYNKKNLDLYHALPISRTALVMSRFYTIAIMFAASTAFQVILLLIARPLMLQKNISFAFGSVFWGLISSCVTALAAVSVFIFCAIIADRMNHYFYYVIGLQGLLPIGIILLLRMPQQHVAGFYLNDTIVGYLFPTANIGLVVTGQGNHWVQLCSMLCICILFLWAAAQFYTKSNRERMDHSPLSSVPIRLVQLGTQFFCTSFLSFLMYLFLLGGLNQLKIFREKPFLSVAFSLPVSLILTILLELFLSKKRRFKSAFIQWGIVSFAAIGVAIFLQGGMLGYENQIPKLEEIKSVTFSDNLDAGKNRNQTYRAFEKIDRNLIRNNSQNKNLLEGHKSVELIEQKSIESILQLHQMSLAFFHGENTRDCHTTYTVTYHLTNGKKMTRSLPYSNNTIDIDPDKDVPSFIQFDYKTENKVVEAYRKVISMEEYLKKSNPFFLKKSSTLSGIQLTSNKTISITDTSFLQEFADTFQQELLADTSLGKAGSVASPYRVGLFYNKEDLPTDLSVLNQLPLNQILQVYSMGQGENLLFDYYWFNIPESYVKTLSLLSRQGYVSALVDLKTIQKAENIVSHFIPVQPESDGSFLLGNDDSYSKTEISDMIKENSHISHLWNYGFDKRAETTTSLMNQLERTQDSTAVFLQNPEGYLVFFTASNKEGGKYYTKMYCLSQADTPEGLRETYEKTKFVMRYHN